MNYTLLDLVVLFFVYSFLGWIIETSVVTIRKKHYGNRGFVSGPFCFIYGFSGVFMTVFLWELKSSPFFLFVGTAIVATVIEWITGKAIERMTHERWWDYSKKRWNIDGYICLQYSLIWGALGSVGIYWLNGWIIQLFDFLPGVVLTIGIWCLIGFCCADVAVSVITVMHKEKEAPEQLLDWNRKLDAWTVRLGHAITSKIQRRIEKAYPDISVEKAIEAAQSRVNFAEFFWLFFLGSFLGDVVETIFCRVTAGVWMSRSSLVWGPFSMVWGLAMAFVTVLLYKDKDKPDRYLFLAGTVLGGAYEYVCSVFTEIVFGKIFWDYSGIPFNLGGRINLLYCFFWGIAAVIWFKMAYPRLHGVIEWILQKTGKWLTMILVLFMIINVGVSMLALVRYDMRGKGVPAKKQWEKVIDERFPDARMKWIYPNAK